MSSEGTIAIAAAVVALVQLWKWAGLRDSWAPLAVILLSVVGVLVWLLSGESWPPSRHDVWPILTGIIAVTLSAAGTFGFTRAGASAVASLTSPPAGGAGSEPSIKSGEPPLTVSAVADELERRRDERVQARLRAGRLEPPEPDPLISKPPEWLPPIPRYG